MFINEFNNQIIDFLPSALLISNYLIMSSRVIRVVVVVRRVTTLTSTPSSPSTGNLSPSQSQQYQEAGKDSQEDHSRYNTFYTHSA